MLRVSELDSPDRVQIKGVGCLLMGVVKPSLEGCLLRGVATEGRCFSLKVVQELIIEQDG
jgi:hypothetical protein